MSRVEALANTKLRDEYSAARAFHFPLILHSAALVDSSQLNRLRDPPSENILLMNNIEWERGEPFANVNTVQLPPSLASYHPIHTGGGEEE